MPVENMLNRRFKWFLSLSAGILLAACSATLDFSECSVNSDCNPGYACSDDGYCVTASSLYGGQL